MYIYMYMYMYIFVYYIYVYIHVYRSTPSRHSTIPGTRGVTPQIITHATTPVTLPFITHGISHFAHYHTRHTSPAPSDTALVTDASNGTRHIIEMTNHVIEVTSNNHVVETQVLIT